MRKIHKMTNIALIFMLTAVFMAGDRAYSMNSCGLRVPVGVNREKMDNVKGLVAWSYGLDLRSAVRHHMDHHIHRFGWDLEYVKTLLAKKTKKENLTRSFYTAYNKAKKYLKELGDIVDEEININVNWESDFRNAFKEFVDNIDEITETISKELDETGANELKANNEAMKFFYKNFVGEDEIKNVDLEKLFQIVNLEAREPFIEKRGLYFESQDEARHIIGREGEIYVAFVNLTRNSVEAIRKGIDEEYKKAEELGIRDTIYITKIKGTISVKVYSDNGYSVTEITDNGPGMSKEALEAFMNRTRYSSKGELGGRGLKAARDIIERNGGTIDVRSKQGKGATFIVRFPQSLPAIRERIIWMYENGLEDAANEIAGVLDMDQKTLEEIKRLRKEMFGYQKHNLKPMISKAKRGSAQDGTSHIVNTPLDGLLSWLNLVVRRSRLEDAGQFKAILKKSLFLMAQCIDILNEWKDIQLDDVDLTQEYSENMPEKYKKFRDLYLELKDNEDFREVFIGTLKQYYVYLKEMDAKLKGIFKYLELRAKYRTSPVDIKNLDNTNATQKSI